VEKFKHRWVIVFVFGLSLFLWSWWQDGSWQKFASVTSPVIQTVPVERLLDVTDNPSAVLEKAGVTLDQAETAWLVAPVNGEYGNPVNHFIPLFI